MSDESLLSNAKNCSEDMFDHIYSELHRLSKEENHAMYMKAISKAKTTSQKKKCDGVYRGKWQVVFNAWCKGKIANTFVLDAFIAGFVSEGLLLRADE